MFAVVTSRRASGRPFVTIRMMASIRRSGSVNSRGRNGSIGTMGSSYDGATQHAMAIANAPYVKAMVPRNAMSNFGRYGVRHNGAFELRFFNWVFTLGNATGPPDAL